MLLSPAAIYAATEPVRLTLKKLSSRFSCVRHADRAPPTEWLDPGRGRGLLPRAEQGPPQGGPSATRGYQRAAASAPGGVEANSIAVPLPLPCGLTTVSEHHGFRPAAPDSTHGYSPPPLRVERMLRRKCRALVDVLLSRRWVRNPQEFHPEMSRAGVSAGCSDRWQ